MTPVWRDESTTSSKFLLTAAAISLGWECSADLIDVATTDHCLALWKGRKSISLPHKNHLNTSQILKGQPGEKSSWHDNPFSHSLRCWLFSHSSSLSVVRASVGQCIGGRMPARTKWADKRPAIRAHTGDSLWWRLHSSTPSETPDMVAPNVFTLTAALSTIGTQKSAPHLTQTYH